MRLSGSGARLLLLCSAVALGLPAAAQARGRHTGYAHASYARHGTAMRGARPAAWLHAGHARFRRYAGGGAVLQCVAFAREDSGIELTGNAVNWWDNAEGVYDRGLRPETGSVLSFRANGHMRLGHVAVVSDVLDSRTIEIDHSHWGSRGISHAMSVIDVSENNDWSAVRVEVGHTGTYGGIYPTHGFIYARPAGGERVAQASTAVTPRLVSLETPARRTTDASFEVAEAPAGRALDLTYAQR
ncbi:MAG: CHAP domain-containing protein [Janthinobacterium lividum]